MIFNHPIFRSKVFETISSLARREVREIYLVGGFLRDLVLGREKEPLDLDFVLRKGAVDFGRRLAKNLKCGFVVLDKERGCCRLVLGKPHVPTEATFDFVDFRGPTLREDLRGRDFTINTLAVRLPLEGEELIDFYGAQKDMAKKVIRAVDERCFDEDPLRVLRAFSLGAIFGFQIAPATLRLIKAKKEMLKDAAGERMRDELFKIFGAENAWRHLSLLDKNGVLEVAIPQVSVMHNVKQGGYHHLDVWGHSMETVRKLEEVMHRLKGRQDIDAYLDEPLAGGRRRRQFVKLAALLHDIGKPKAYEVKAGKTMFHGHERIGRIISDSVSERLKLSTRERFALDTIIFWHLRPGYLADNEVLTSRAVRRYFRDTEEEAVSVLLVSIADQRATRGPLATPQSRIKHEKVSFSLIERYFERLKQKPLVRLLSGADLIKRLKLAPGPIFSVILDAVEEAQAEGSIKTKREALALARGLAQKTVRPKSGGRRRAGQCADDTVESAEGEDGI